MAPSWSRALAAARPALLSAARTALRSMTGQGARHPQGTVAGPTGPTRAERARRAGPARSGTPGSGTSRAEPPHGGYPGDYTGTLVPEYAPVEDALPDPGEVVWSWVPYEEDHARGKDRPALVVGRDGHWLLALPLTSKDHDRDEEQENRAGRYWVDVGAGAWDTKGRPSEARVDRVVRLDPAGVRREGVRLDRARFDEVAAAVAARR